MRLVLPIVIAILLFEGGAGYTVGHTIAALDGGLWDTIATAVAGVNH